MTPRKRAERAISKRYKRLRKRQDRELRCIDRGSLDQVFAAMDKTLARIARLYKECSNSNTWVKLRMWIKRQ